MAVWFFVRKYNDIDHMVPVVHGFATSEPTLPIKLICTSPSYPFRSDPRIALLSQHKNLTTSFLYEMDPSPIGVLSALFLSSGILRKTFYERVMRRRLNSSWFEYQLKKNQVTLVVFDSSAKRNVDFYPEVHLACSRLKIPIVLVPHACIIATNSHTQQKKIYSDLSELVPTKTLLTSRTVYDEFVENHFSQDRLAVTGSVRFTESWIKILTPLYKAESEAIPGSQSALKILFLARPAGKNAARTLRLTLNTLNALSKIPNSELIVKAHTRNHKIEFQEISSGTRIVGAETNTFPLMLWADVVIGLGSSALIDAFLLKKPVLVPLYLQGENDALAELLHVKHSVATSAKNLEDLITLVTRAMKNRSELLPDEAKLKSFLDQYVWATLENTGKSPIQSTVQQLLNLNRH